jgi:glycosyltransferase involved in cell wall biosynthesis
LLEASVGRACIAYDVGGDSLIINNDNGLIVKSKSVEELAENSASC